MLAQHAIPCMMDTRCANVLQVLQTSPSAVGVLGDPATSAIITDALQHADFQTIAEPLIQCADQRCNAGIDDFLANFQLTSSTTVSTSTVTSTSAIISSSPTALPSAMPSEMPPPSVSPQQNMSCSAIEPSQCVLENCFPQIEACVTSGGCLHPLLLGFVTGQSQNFSLSEPEAFEALLSCIDNTTCQTPGWALAVNHVVTIDPTCVSDRCFGEADQCMANFSCLQQFMAFLNGDPMPDLDFLPESLRICMQNSCATITSEMPAPTSTVTTTSQTSVTTSTSSINLLQCWSMQCSDVQRRCIADNACRNLLLLLGNGGALSVPNDSISLDLLQCSDLRCGTYYLGPYSSGSSSTTQFVLTQTTIPTQVITSALITTPRSQTSINEPSIFCGPGCTRLHSEHVQCLAATCQQFMLACHEDARCAVRSAAFLDDTSFTLTPEDIGNIHFEAILQCADSNCGTNFGAIDVNGRCTQEVSSFPISTFLEIVSVPACQQPVQGINLGGHVVAAGSLYLALETYFNSTITSNLCRCAAILPLDIISMLVPVAGCTAVSQHALSNLPHFVSSCDLQSGYTWDPASPLCNRMCACFVHEENDACFLGRQSCSCEQDVCYPATLTVMTRNSSSSVALMGVDQNVDPQTGPSFECLRGLSRWPDQISFSTNDAGAAIVDARYSNLVEINSSTLHNLHREAATTLRVLLFGHSDNLVTIDSQAVRTFTALTDLRFDHCAIQELPCSLFTGLSRLQKLHLQGNIVSRLCPTLFAWLTSLQHLYLENNKITNLLPTQFSNLVQLKKLYLQGNLIREIMPQTFVRNTLLELLDLSNNKIALLPGTIFMTCLGESVDLSVRETIGCMLNPINVLYGGNVLQRCVHIRGNPLTCQECQTGVQIELEPPTPPLQGRDWYAGSQSCPAFSLRDCNDELDSYQNFTAGENGTIIHSVSIGDTWRSTRIPCNKSMLFQNYARGDLSSVMYDLVFPDVHIVPASVCIDQEEGIINLTPRAGFEGVFLAILRAVDVLGATVQIAEFRFHFFARDPFVRNPAISWPIRVYRADELIFDSDNHVVTNFSRVVPLMIGASYRIPVVGNASAAQRFWNFAGSADGSSISYSLQLQHDHDHNMGLHNTSAPPLGSILVDSSSGYILLADLPVGVYLIWLWAQDSAGQRIPVWDSPYYFQFVEPDPFRRSSLEWPFYLQSAGVRTVVYTSNTSYADHVSMVTSNITLNTSYQVPNPTLPKSLFFLNAFNNDSTKIRFQLQFILSSTSQMPAAGNVMVDSESGYIQARLTRRGNFTARLVATDGGEGSVVILVWVFQVKASDYSDASNGPNGRDCGDHGTAVDLVPFDNRFTCECSAVYTGANCDDRILTASSSGSSDSQLSDGSIWALIASGIVVIVFAGYTVTFCMRERRRRIEANKPHDFMQELAVVQGMGIDGNSFDRIVPAELSRSNVTIVEELGSGEFGRVKKGILQHSRGVQFEIAVKLLKENAPSSERAALLEEATITAQFDHPNVVGFVGVVTVGEPILVLLQYCSKGDLRTYLRGFADESDKGSVEVHMLVGLASGVANGMSYLASRKLVHRDLAARNILLDAASVPKVSTQFL